MNRVERLIDADADRVWSLISDVERWDQMLPTMKKVTRIDGDGPLGVGARFDVAQPGLRRAVYQVSEWRPGIEFTWTSSAPGLRTTASHELHAENGRTRLILGVTWTGPLAGVARLLVGAKALRMVEQEADAFFRLAERDGGDGAGVV